jgi:large subunit ribosomal protein L17
MVTLGKRNDLHARRLAFAFLRQKEAVRKLFADIAPRSGSRQGGYVRIIKLGPRLSDSAPMAYVEWVDQAVVEEKTAAAEKETAKK